MSTKRENLFKQRLEDMNNKTPICICEKRYTGDLSGGFISNGLTHIWCCSRECADKTRSKLY